MAEIAAFRGILYDPSKVEASKVLSPPYDVIDAAERARLAALDPHNSVRLILPEGDGDAKYGNAKQTLDAWLDEGVMKRDARPAIYRYHQIFTSDELGGRPFTRRGFIAAVRLHRFDEKIILPHERTLAGPKVDRLKLKDATRTHLSQIFTLYDDPSGETDRVFAAIEKTPAYLDGTTADGTRHLLWRVDDQELVARLARLMAPLKLYIADGHHRYETMLALREKIRAEHGGALPSRSTAEFGTMFLANMNDRGLVVLPTHRLIRGVDGFDADRFLADLRAYFDVAPLAGKASDAAALRTALADAGAQHRTAFALVLPGRADAYLLTMRSDFRPTKVGIDGPPAVVNLDVAILHGVVFEHILKIDRAAQAAQSNLEYFKDTGKALKAVQAGEGQAMFLMNATRVEQVRQVSDVGEVMPQKSTFFVPKIASGLVLNPLSADEEL